MSLCRRISLPSSKRASLRKCCNKWCRSSRLSDTLISPEVYSLTRSSFTSYNISLTFSNRIQVQSPAVATWLGSFETIITSFRPFDMESAPMTVRFHPSLSRIWILIPFPNVRKPKMSGVVSFLPDMLNVMLLITI